MPKKVQPVRFVPDQGTGYLTDRGAEIAANSRFILPPDIAESNVNAILTAIGANNLANTGDPVPCSDSVTGTLRRLEFIRTDKSSMSVPVSSRANLNAAASTIQGILNSTVEVVCIKLNGEYFPFLNDELGLNYADTFAVSHVPVTGTKQYFYSGTVQYSTDANSGVQSLVAQNIKSISNNENAPATQIASAWAGCVGDLSNVLPCRGVGRRNPRAHRRYEMTFLTKADPSNGAEAAQSETIEVPVISAAANDINQCGTVLAGLTGAYCIGYRGESYSRFHKVL